MNVIFQFFDNFENRENNRMKELVLVNPTPDYQGIGKIKHSKFHLIILQTRRATMQETLGMTNSADLNC